MNAPWRIQLLGSINARSGDQAIRRFQTTRTAALAARLALFPNRSHPREELIDLLWPDADIEAGRLNLRVALSSLRRQLEPPGTAAGSVFVADRNSVRANPDAITCDVTEFESALKDAKAKQGAARREAIEHAVAIYGGEFMPGVWDEWVLLERQRLESVFDEAQLELEQLPAADRTEAKTKAPLPVMETAEPPLTGLPLQFTRFFGRDQEVTWLANILREPIVRLVTITGPAGVGKTRLAIEAARRVGADFGGRVHFVPLASLADAGLFTNRIAESLKIQMTGEQLTLSQIAAFLAGARHLLVLDNLEHLGQACAMEIRSLLETSERLTCLCTSQHLLALTGERELALQPLAAPQGEDSPDRLTEFPSIRLFVDRAQAVRFDFQVTQGNGDAVAGVCRQLEGIPLAIELAAARINVLTPAQMREQISARFEFLTSRRKDLSPRHRSLRAALEWSVQLLTVEQAQYYKQLSVFRGGWSLESAAAITGSDNMLDMLEQLRERSLIMSEERLHGMRFRMLESLREYGSELLGDADRIAISRRHALYCLDLVQRTSSLWFGRRQTEGAEILDAESDNLRAALGFCRASEASNDWDGIEIGVSLAGALGVYWSTRGLIREGLDWLDAALARGGSKSARALALREAGWLSAALGRYERAEAAFEESIALGRALGDKAGASTALRCRGISRIWQDRIADAKPDLEEALELAREAGHERSLAAAMNALGVLSHALGEDINVARVFYEEALGHFQACGDRQWTSYCLHNLGDVAREMGNYDLAEERMAQSLRIAEELGDVWQRAYCLMSLGNILSARREYGRAKSSLAQSRDLTRRLGDRQTEAMILCHLGDVAQHMNDMREAERLYNESFAIRREIGDTSGYTVCWIGLVETACQRKDWKEAVRQLAKIIAAGDRPSNRELRLRVASIQQSVSEAMGEQRYQSAMDREKEPMEQAR